ncbi:MAG TPA: ABC transporter permease [Spirochaetia bacterium]|nr:ABC transporter permease [Spirochaetia bacterium]
MTRRTTGRVVVDNLPWLLLVALVGVFTGINPRFVGPFSLANIFSVAAPLLCLSLGATFVIITGSIDLSVGAIVSASCVIYGTTFPVLGNWSIVVAVAFGFLAGSLNGLLFTWLKIPSFMVTLAASALWKSVALILVGGGAKGIPMELWKGLKWAEFSLGVVPILFLVALCVFGLYLFIQTKSALGRAIFAVGANERAARMFGLNVNSTKFWAFAMSGAGSALAGAFYSIELKTSLATIGDPVTLLAIAAVVIGGTPLTGGRGSVLRTLLGALLVVIIQNGLNTVAVDPYWQQIVFGAFTIVAVYLNSERGGRNLIVK